MQIQRHKTDRHMHIQKHPSCTGIYKDRKINTHIHKDRQTHAYTDRKINTHIHKDRQTHAYTDRKINTWI
jgi:Zn-finger nucleic acid-binding protein